MRNRSSRRRSDARAPESAPCRPFSGCPRSNSRDRRRAGHDGGIPRPATRWSRCRGCVSPAADRRSCIRPRRRHRASRSATPRRGGSSDREIRRSWFAPGFLRPCRGNRHKSSRPFRCRGAAPADRPKTAQTVPASPGQGRDRQSGRDLRCGCAWSIACGRIGRRQYAPARTRRKRGRPGGRQSDGCGETRRATTHRRIGECRRRRARRSACAPPEPGYRGTQPARWRRIAAMERSGRR